MHPSRPVAKSSPPDNDQDSARPHPDVYPIPPAPPSRFEVAVARAQARYTVEQWALLEPSTRTANIYAELRRLDSGGGPVRQAAE